MKGWRGEKFRIWSAASSSGEEAYSLAMILAESLSHRPWEIIASNLSTQVLTKAQEGIYLMDRIELLDQHLLGKYCLKGVRSQEGTFRVNEKLRKRTRFGQINLMKPIPASIGMLVDQVDEIIEIPNKNIQPAPEFGTDIRVEFIQSMGRVDEKFIILLEISRVLSVTELSQLSHSINADSASIPETDSQ